MRKRYRVLLLAAIVAALVVPVGFALSLESTASALRTPRAAAVTTAPAAVASSIILKPVQLEPTTTPLVRQMPDSAKLLLVGTALFGLAAAVRRAI